MQRLNVVDLFCGCGGLSCGFKNAGFSVSGSFDNWAPALSVYNDNLPDCAEALDLSDLSKSFERLDSLFDNNRISGIIGGPPCQDFSSAGKRIEASRADLTEKYADIVCRYHPPLFPNGECSSCAESQRLQESYRSSEGRGLYNY